MLFTKPDTVIKMKKAQGLPLNTIVIAVLVLLILVVLIIIFGKYIGGFAKGVKSCESSGGEGCFNNCNPETLNLPAGSIIANIPGTECEDKGQKCCKVVYKAQTQP